MRDADRTASSSIGEAIGQCLAVRPRGPAAGGEPRRRRSTSAARGDLGGSFARRNTGENRFPAETGKNRFPAETEKNRFPSETGKNRFPAETGENRFPPRAPGARGESGSEAIIGAFHDINRIINSFSRLFFLEFWRFSIVFTVPPVGPAPGRLARSDAP